MSTGKANRIILTILAVLAVLIAAGTCWLLHRNIQKTAVITLPAEVTAAGKDYLYEITECGTDEMMSLTRNGMAQVGGGKEYLTVEGWAGVYGEETAVFNTAVLLQPDKEDNTFTLLKTTYISNRESPKADNGDVSFEKGWFVAKVRKSDLVSGEKYRVYLWYQNDGHNELIETDKYLKVK